MHVLHAKLPDECIVRKLATIDRSHTHSTILAATQARAYQWTSNQTEATISKSDSKSTPKRIQDQTDCYNMPINITFTDLLNANNYLMGILFVSLLPKVHVQKMK